MVKLTKFDVILYLIPKEIQYEELSSFIRQNLFFEKVTNRKIKAILRELRKDDFVLKKKNSFSLNVQNQKLIDVLAFLLWSKKDSIDYNQSFGGKSQLVFKKIFEDYTIENAIKEIEFSKTVKLKILNSLRKINFISITKKKPLGVKAQINDKTLLFANIFEYNLSSFEKTFDLTFPKKESEKLKQSLIKLHVYSTTVTEGNTATEGDVEKVLKNFNTKLSPREVIEIVNAKNAVEELYRVYKTEDLSIDLIKNLHKVLMASLLENPGEFSYVRKRLIGSATNLPDSKIEIDTSIQAMINFYSKYKDKIHPIVLAPLIHFIFVSIHPFIDGNGRVARLMHSLILLKSGFPIFAFDPNYRNTYFDLLDKSRTSSVEDFIKFCMEKHKELIGKI